MAKETEKEFKIDFKQGDRVKRAGTAGPSGTVKQIRQETTRQTMRTVDGGEPPGVAVSVLWDNGSLAHFIPEGLEKI
jgi:hypothetical protein